MSDQSFKPTDLFGCDPDFVPAPSDYELGVIAGVQAAREAVAAVACGPQGSSNRFWRDTALAAIDALTTRGKGRS